MTVALGRGYTFGATETVTATKLHTLVDSGTVTGIEATNIADGTITDTQISSVSGAKFVTLNLIPAGAGVIPVANIDVGATANKIVQLDSSAKLPAVDGSQLTDLDNLNADNITTGTLSPDRLAAGGDETKYFRGDGTWQVVTGSGTDTNTSNCVFSFGSGDDAGSYYGIFTSSTITPDGSSDGNYIYWGNVGSVERTMIRTKFKKISTISLVTVYAYIASNPNLAHATTCKITIGTATPLALTSTTANSREWVSGDIDVSGLTNGTTYDVTITLKGNYSATKSALHSIIGIGT